MLNSELLLQPNSSQKHVLSILRPELFCLFYLMNIYTLYTTLCAAHLILGWASVDVKVFSSILFALSTICYLYKLLTLSWINRQYDYSMLKFGIVENMGLFVLDIRFKFLFKFRCAFISIPFLPQISSDCAG